MEKNKNIKKKENKINRMRIKIEKKITYWKVKLKTIKRSRKKFKNPINKVKYQ